MKRATVNRYISTTKEVVDQLKSVVDKFINREIDEKEFETIVGGYFDEHSDLIYKDDNEIKSSVVNVLGKRRMKLINKAIEQIERKSNRGK